MATRMQALSAHQADEATPRLFVAIELPARIRSLLAGIQNELRAPGVRAAWVPEANFHMTLVFIGATRADRLIEIGNLVDAIASAIAPFEVELFGLGVFGRRPAPRTVWAGVRRQPEAARRLADLLGHALRDRGFPVDRRPFVPHVTLARFRSPSGVRPILPALHQAASRPIADAIRIRHIALMNSRPSPAGPRYARLRRSPLGTAVPREP